MKPIEKQKSLIQKQSQELLDLFPNSEELPLLISFYLGSEISEIFEVLLDTSKQQFNVTVRGVYFKSFEFKHGSPQAIKNYIQLAMIFRKDDDVQIEMLRRLSSIVEDYPDDSLKNSEMKKAIYRLYQKLSTFYSPGDRKRIEKEMGFTESYKASLKFGL